MFNYHRRSYGLIVPVLLALIACAMPPGSYSKTTVNGAEKTYRYEEGGGKTLVYEVDRNGKLIVYDPNDKQAQQRLGLQKHEQQAEQKQAARMERIRQAPKRKQGDPIFVSFQPIESEIEMSEKQKQDIFDFFKKNLEDDPVIRLINRPNSKSTSGKLRQAAGELKSAGTGKPKSDVNLVITVSTTTVYGTIKGKLAEAKAMVFKAKMTGNWLPATQKAEETGTLFQLPEATRKLSEKIKKLVKEEIGPTIPADRSL